MSSVRVLAGVAAAWMALPCWPQTAPSRALAADAIANNRDLMAVRQLAEEARGLLRQAGLRPALTVELTGTTGVPLGTRGEEQYGAGVSQVMETGGKRTLRVRVAERQLAQALAQYDERVRQLRFELRSKYAEYSGDLERLQTTERLVQSYTKSLELLTARVEQGDTAAIERDLMAVELGRVMAQRSALEGRLRAARAELARAAGLADVASVPPHVEPMADLRQHELATLKELARKQRPDLRTALTAMEQGQAETDLARAQGRGDLTVTAGYTRVYSRFDEPVTARLRDRDDVLSVGVSMPLFTQRRNQGNLDAAVARARGAQLRSEALARAIGHEVDAAWQRAESAQRSYLVLSGTVVQQAERNLEVIRQAHQLGQLRLLDVLNEQRRLLDLQFAAIDVKTDALRSMAQLELAVGGEL